MEAGSSWVLGITGSLLPERFGGEGLLIATLLVLLAVNTALVFARWRSHRRLLFPGLEQVLAWERLATARPVVISTDAASTSAAAVAVPVVAVPDVAVPDVAVLDVAVAVADPVRRSGGEVTVVARHQATVIPFADLHAAMRARIGLHLRIATTAVLLVAAVMITLLV
jgi:hypothetical protein